LICPVPAFESLLFGSRAHFAEWGRNASTAVQKPPHIKRTIFASPSDPSHSALLPNLAAMATASSSQRETPHPSHHSKAFNKLVNQRACSCGRSDCVNVLWDYYLDPASPYPDPDNPQLIFKVKNPRLKPDTRKKSLAARRQQPPGTSSDSWAPRSRSPPRPSTSPAGWRPCPRRTGPDSRQ
jgi:hypothetical protein